ncbi:MAG: UvrD-helicase domain-containing protein, partial [Actinomycetota bacterium]|nr:UvrD-helicase domain-containing protein [Actinomycetota bacterium]
MPGQNDEWDLFGDFPALPALDEPAGEQGERPAGGALDAEALLGDLNLAQREAVAHLDGPLVVVAGAGSGKTRVLTRRIARLVALGVPPWRILAITFTNKAADEMRSRVAALVGEEASRMWVST